MSKFGLFAAIILIIFIPLYPKFPLVGIGGSFVSIRLEDFLIAAAVFLWTVHQFKTRFRDLHLPAVQSIILYLCVGLVSLISATFLTKSVDLKIGLLHEFRRVEYMSMFVIGLWAIKSKADIKFITRALLLVSLMVSLFGLGQQFLNFPVISTTNSEFAKGLAVTLGSGARINSTFAGHYDLAAFSILPILLCLGILAQSIDLKNRLAILFIGSLSYWTVLLSASRVTFAAIILTSGLFILIIRKFSWLPILLIIAAISIFISPQLFGRYKQLFAMQSVSAAPVDKQVLDALKPTLQPEDRSFSIRLNAEWPRAVRAFKINPILGTGFSSVGLAVDNDYLRLLAESGLLGLLAFGLIILRIFKTSLPYLRKQPHDLQSTFVIVVTLFLVGILANAIFIDVFEASKVAIITWLMLGLSEKVKTLHE